MECISNLPLTDFALSLLDSHWCLTSPCWPCDTVILSSLAGRLPAFSDSDPSHFVLRLEGKKNMFFPLDNQRQNPFDEGMKENTLIASWSGGVGSRGWEEANVKGGLLLPKHDLDRLKWNKGRDAMFCLKTVIRRGVGDTTRWEKIRKEAGREHKKGKGWSELREDSGGIDTAEKSISCLISSSLIQTCVGGFLKKRLGDMQHEV